MPRPRLNTSCISASATFPARCTSAKMPGAFEQRLAGEGVTVLTQAGARDTDDDVARAHTGWQDASTLDDADGEADEVELTRLHDVVLRHLTAEQRAARGAAPVRDARDDVGDDLLHQLAGRDVVEEEQRFRTLHRDVVDATRDEVDTDRVVLRHEPGNQRLRADAVGRRDENRIAHSPRLVREEPSESADVADHLGPQRRTHVLLDELD